MLSRIVIPATVLFSVAGLVSALAKRPPAKIQVTVATLHAAALTAPRAATDSVDGPYYLVSVLGPGNASRTMHLPENGHLRIHENEALGERPLIDVSLGQGDTVRLLVSVLEGAKDQGSAEIAAATASTKLLEKSPATLASSLPGVLDAVTKNGAHLLGTATLTLTNEHGTAYWRGIQCVADCDVLSGGDAAAFSAANVKLTAGVVELSGAGGTYHMKLQGHAAD
jgi:hypothetical protein